MTALTNTRELKSNNDGDGCFKLYRAYCTSFSTSNVGNWFGKLNSKRQYRGLQKEKESRCLVFSSSVKREIRQFHVVVVQSLQRNVQKT